eukprot:3739496-Rhodomonas_salina.1
MSPPEVIKKSPLANKDGFVDVDKYTLQSTKANPIPQNTPWYPPVQFSARFVCMPPLHGGNAHHSSDTPWEQRAFGQASPQSGFSSSV